MTTSGAIDLPLQVFGSYCPELPPASLPAGLSPWTQDCEYIRGGVKTRPGLAQQFQLPGNPTINYLRTYITPTEVLRLLALDSLGNVYKETPMGTLNTVIGNVAPGCYGKSTTCFGREYIAFGDGINGIDIPRQYDDTNFDRVSQVGPGRAPGAIDDIAYALIGAGSITPVVYGVGPTCTEVGNIVTVQLGAVVPPNLVGQAVLLAGFAPGGYNGTFVALTASGTSFTYLNPTTGLAPGAGGTIDFGTYSVTTAVPNTYAVGENVTISGSSQAALNAAWRIYQVNSSTNFFIYTTVFGGLTANNGSSIIAGNISAGVHQLSVVFVTRQGYITAPAPPSKWTAAGGLRVIVSSIPIGPPNVVARILIFTATGGANFFYTGPQSPIFGGNMIISDNTTTSITVDFTDPVLLAGINADELFNLVELGECAGVIDYSDRMFWWGERNKVPNFLNLTFDGGFLSGSTFPLGWTPGPANAAGGALIVSSIWGNAWQATMVGVGTFAEISQPAFQDFRGVPILFPATQYSLRFRVAASSVGALNVTPTFTLSSVLTGFVSTAAITIPASVGIPYEFIIQFTLPTPATIPPDFLLTVSFVHSTVPPVTLAIDNIEIFPTNQPFNLTTVRASFNPGENANLGPESFDGVTGLLQPQPFDGQGIRCMFKLREFLYIVKERSLYVTQDDGVNEPSGWSIHQVSGSVGTPSVNGVAIGEDWAIIANRNGLYMFNGGEPTKISQEIQSNQTDIPLLYYWDNVDWSIGQFLWTLVDTLNRRMFVSLPFKGITIEGSSGPNAMFYLDYRPMSDSGDIIASTPIHTSYAGKVINYEHSRKWNPWNVTAKCGAVIERADGTGQVFFGSNLRGGQIWSLSESQPFDELLGLFASLATDNFNRANQSPINTNWKNCARLGNVSPGQVLGNQYVAQAGLSSAAIFDGGVIWPSDQFSQATLRSLTVGSGYASLIIRGNALNANSYAMVLDGTNVGNVITGGIGQPTNCRIFDSANTPLPNGVVIIPQIGDVFLVQIIGSTISVFQNGNQLFTTQPVGTLITTGSPGVSAAPTFGVVTDIAWDNWSGGVASVTAINSFYTPYGIPSHDEEQGLQLGSHKKDFTYLTAYVEGAGLLTVNFYQENPAAVAQKLTEWTLDIGTTRDHEMSLGGNITAERGFFQFGTNAVGSFFKMQKLVPSLKPGVIPMRGLS